MEITSIADIASTEPVAPVSNDADASPHMAPPSDSRNSMSRGRSGMLRTKENAVKPITASVAEAVTMTSLSVPTLYRMMDRTAPR